MLNHVLKYSWLFALCSVVFFTACNSDNEVITEEELDEFADEALFRIQETGKIGRDGCYELVFPVTLTFADGTELTANSYEELKEGILAWKEANPDVNERPELNLPVEVINEDGDVISVATQEELRELREACRRDRFGDRRPRGHFDRGCACFHIVFPVTIAFPDGTTAEAEDRAAFKMLIRQWKHDNPNVDARPELVFPINIEMRDGTIVSVMDREELRAIKEECRD